MTSPSTTVLLRDKSQAESQTAGARPRRPQRGAEAHRAVGCDCRGEIGGMADFERPGDDEDGAKHQAHEEHNDMSPSPKTSGQRGQTETKPPGGRSAAAWVSGAIALIAVGAIIAYAVLHANRAVPGAAVATGSPQLPPQLQAGTKAPSFELPGKIGTFSSAQLAGTPYLLEIFATWCPHCQRMTKVLRAVRAQVPESKLAMVSVTGSPYAANSTPDNLVPEN